MTTQEQDAARRAAEAAQEIEGLVITVGCEWTGESQALARRIIREYGDTEVARRTAALREAAQRLVDAPSTDPRTFPRHDALGERREWDAKWIVVSRPAMYALIDVLAALGGASGESTDA